MHWVRLRLEGQSAPASNYLTRATQPIINPPKPIEEVRFSAWCRRSSIHWCPNPTARSLLLFLPPWHHNRRHVITRRQLQQRATGQTHTVRHRLAKYAQAHAAHIAQIHYTLMAETRRAKVDFFAAGHDQPSPCGGVGKICHHEVLQHCWTVLESGGGAEIHVDTTCSVTGLLEEAGVSGKLEDVDGDMAPLRSKDGIHDGNVLRAKVRRDGQYENAGD